MLVTNALDKKENNAQVTFAQAIAVFSLSGIIYDLAQFIAYILRLFNLDFFYKVGNIVTSFAGGFRAMLLALLLMLFVKNKNKLPLIYACVAGVNAIASILIGLIFAA